MQASDVMTENVITVNPDTTVAEIIAVLIEYHIKVVPVVDSRGQVVGVVSEGDVVRRVSEAGRRSWWQRNVVGGSLHEEYRKTYSRKAKEIMTANPVMVTPELPLQEVGLLMRQHGIRLVPVVRASRMIGVVSRTDVLRYVSAEAREAITPPDDKATHDAIWAQLTSISGEQAEPINVVVVRGKVEIWGLVSSREQKHAIQEAAENTPGVKSVENFLGVRQQDAGGTSPTL